METVVDQALDALVADLPAGTVVTAEASLEKYRHDFIRDPSAGMPLAAVRPASVEEVQTCLRWASRHTVAVVTRGAGTGLSGGARALDGCLVLSTERLTDVTVDPAARVVVAGAGALNVAVKEAAAEHGLWYPPDPGSFRISTIGGNVATNAGGLCCLKHGVTSTYVLGLDVVLADGRRVQLGGRTVKNVAGLSLTQLLVGSEGTLGVVVSATLRLVPAPPPQVTVAATFGSVRAAGAAVVAIGRGLRPSMLELLDRQSINNVEDYRPSGLDRTSAAMLIAQCDDVSAAQAVADACAEAGAAEVHLTEDPVDGDMLVETRRATGPAVEVRGALLPEDIAVPVDRLPDVLEAVEDLAAELGLEIPVVAHAGDGNVHPTIVYDASDPDEHERALVGFSRLMRIALDVGGTITGEHGVGRAKRAMLAEQLDPVALELAAAVKTALDPAGLLNPGVGF